MDAPQSFAIARNPPLLLGQALPTAPDPFSALLDDEPTVQRCRNHLYVDTDLREPGSRLFAGLVPSCENIGVYVSTVTRGTVGEPAMVRLTLHSGSIVSASSEVWFTRDIDDGMEEECGLGFILRNLCPDSWNLLRLEIETYPADLFEKQEPLTPRRATPHHQGPRLEQHGYHEHSPRFLYPPRTSPEARCDLVVAEAFRGTSRDRRFEMGFASDCRRRVFVATSSPRPVGARLDLWLVSPSADGGMGRLRATVRWVRVSREGQGDPWLLPGMGLELDDTCGLGTWDGCLLCGEYT